MGCGASSSRSSKDKKKELTAEQFEQLKAEIGVGHDFSGGDWWWGHPFGSKDPPGVSFAGEAATALLPDYHRDVIRLKMCPSHMDHVAKKSPNAANEFMGATFHLGHADVTKMLEECPLKHVKGEISRGNELGYLLLADSAFPRFGTIGLGLPVKKHNIVRNLSTPLIARIPGRGGLTKDIQEFLRGRRKVALPDDIDNWWCRMLWRYLLRKEMTTEEASAFISFRSNWLVAAVAQMKELSVAHLVFQMDDVQSEQEKYRSQVETLLAANADIPTECRGDVAQAVLEMICFAGGLSVPQTITSALAAMFHGFMPDPVTEENVLPFVYEVTRLFPAVQGFGLWTNDGKRHVLSLNGALRDPKAWGPDADRFTLKDVKLYKEKHCGFANQAVAPDDGDSKRCPGIRVALDAVQAAVLAFGTWAPQGKTIDSIWRPQSKIEPAGKPSFWKPYILERIPQKEKRFFEDLLDRDHTGEDTLLNLSPVEISALMDSVDKDRDAAPDALRLVDRGTLLFYGGALTVWQDMSSIKIIDVPLEPKLGPYNDKNSILFLGGIRLPMHDEQWSGNSVLRTLGFNFASFVNSMQDDDIHEDLYVRTQEQRQKAVVVCQRAFDRGPNGASFLPICKAPFKDLASDATQGILARYGGGQLFLRPNKDAGREELGEVACDFGALVSFEVRPAFERLGAVAYFKVEEGSGDFTITAVDWKHADKLVRPGDAEWEHAKFVYRCSMGTFCTAVCHLTWCHWIQANALSSSLREAFSPNHPIRRVMHVNQYNTAYINMTSYATLYAANGFLHRLCPYSYESLQGVFKYAVDSFKYQTLPEQYAESALPEAIKSKLPVYEDGLPLWQALRDFYGCYLDLYYPDEKALLADEEVVSYWQFKSCPPYRNGLPALSKKSLADQLAQACFDVTAYHEYVGSAVGYLTDPAGAFMQVRPGCDMADIQQMVQALSLASTTGSPMPAYTSDWSHMLNLGHGAKVNHYKEAVEVWRGMQKKLEELTKEVDARNSKRLHPFPHYNPRYLECSVNL